MTTRDKPVFQTFTLPVREERGYQPKPAPAPPRLPQQGGQPSATAGGPPNKGPGGKPAK